MQEISSTDALAESIVSILKEKNYTITTAESCTGGLLSAKIVDIPGSSVIFKEGHITYSNEVKEKYLNVSIETLSLYGAVSCQTAKEMAEGAAKLAKAEAALSVTGLAGPDGMDAIPAGTVYIGCFLNGRTTVQHHLIKGNRNEVRQEAVERALLLLYRCLLDADSNTLYNT